MNYPMNGAAAGLPALLSPAAAARLVKITGHRGARGIAPENTLTGFQVALDLGVDMIELDVHLTRDGELAVMHDPRVERTTDGEGAIGSFTLAELKRLNAAAKFSGETPYGVQRVPTLQEVYDLVGNQCTLNVEIKPAADGTRYEGIEEKLIEFLHRNDPANRTVISSFDHPTLVKIHELEPRLTRHGIVSHEYFAALPTGPMGAQAAVDDFVARGLTWMAINHAYLTENLCARMKRAGLTVHAWVIDDLAGLARFASMGVDEITSDRPDVLLAARREQMTENAPEGGAA
jgi:glycerophosphoryl diester phosphodiesterase